MIASILVVCVGNICRSPVGERLLARTGLKVGSAGLAAVVGAPADPVTASVAADRGLSLEGHVARQFTPELAADYDLILVMEPGHREEIRRMAPHLSGKVMLFDRWIGGQGIEDPYRRTHAIQAAVQDRIALAAEAWAEKLGRTGE